MRLWLIGMMGSGKSTVGRSAADRLGIVFVDTDDEIEKGQGSTIAEIWTVGGEETFRALECEAVTTAAELSDAIIATGGGAVMSAANRVSMAGDTVVWLSAGSTTILNRLIGLPSGRPLLEETTNRADRLGTLLEERRVPYESLASHIIETDGQSVDDVVEQVMAIWNR